MDLIIKRNRKSKHSLYVYTAILYTTDRIKSTAYAMRDDAGELARDIAERMAPTPAQWGLIVSALLTLPAGGSVTIPKMGISLDKPAGTV